MALLTTILFTLILSACSGISVNRQASKVDNWTHIKDRGYVVVGVDDTFVPMDFQQKDGKLVGYDVDLANAVFKLYGIKVSFQTIDWSMNTTELRNGTIDVIWNGFSKTPAREAKVNFSKTYLDTTQVIVALKKNHINSIKDMQNKALGAQSGSSGYNDIMDYPKVLANRIKDHYPILYDSFTNAFIDLNTGRIDGLLIDSSFPKEQFGVGMRKSDITLQRKINHGLDILAKNGTLDRINHKWFGDKAQSPLLKK